jgi:hypothetical protein
VARLNRRKRFRRGKHVEAFALMMKCALSCTTSRPRLAHALDLSLQHQLSL